MSVIYLRSTDGNDADDGSTWALAKATLAAALTAAGAGGTVYVSQAHAETQAGAMALASPGTIDSFVRVICANDGAEPPTARATTATVTVSGNANITYSGFAYSYGITYKGAGSNTPHRFGAGSETWWVIEDGLVECTSSSATQVRVGNNSAQAHLLELINTPLKFANVGGTITLIGRLRWRNTANAIQGTAPTVLVSPNALNAPRFDAEGVDFSALGSGKSLVNVASGAAGLIRFIDCKLGSSVAVATGSWSGRGGPDIQMVNCDSADTQYRFAQALYQGMGTSETTIVRTGGATDGTTPVSRKIVSTSGAHILSPYESMPIEFWNEVTGSAITVSIPTLTDGVTLTDAEAWLEVEYLGTSGFPLGLFASDRVSDPIFGTPANQATDSTSSWNDGSLGSPVKQTLSVTFTPEEKGIVRARVCVAKASTTVYYDPKAITASGRQYQSAAGFVNEGGSVRMIPGMTGGLL